jgi:hypothetical protein
MKRFSLFFIMMLPFFTLKAQNVQLHYDTGSHLYEEEYAGRPELTSTVEYFKPDRWGNSFFFIDMDYTHSGIASAYWEIARELKFWQPPVAIHVEYNGGLTTNFPFNNAYLGGVSYAWNNAEFTKTFTFSAMYKHIQKHEHPHNFQLTGTWQLDFGKNGICTFSGFADWWREENMYGNFILLAEPQFWLNLNRLNGVSDQFNLSAGSEVKISNNFGGHNGFFVIPTIAIKWSW